MASMEVCGMLGAVDRPAASPTPSPAEMEEPTPPPQPAHPRNPLQGITLEMIVTQMVEWYGWPELGRQIPVRCFLFDPSVKSSLTFLRKTPWARQKLERWYVAEKRRRAKRERAALRDNAET